MAAAGQEAAAVRQLATSRMPGFVAGVKRLLVRSRTQPTHWRLARLAIDLA